MRKELAALPLIVPQVPYPVPAPRYAGEPSDDIPWHFGGYEILLGVTACSRDLSDEERRQLARRSRAFPQAPARIDPAAAARAGLPPMIRSASSTQRDSGRRTTTAGLLRIVHGDLYARHLLLDQRNRLCGVIDWGDVHYGLPAVDLSAVHMMMPVGFHHAFFAAYGRSTNGRGDSRAIGRATMRLMRSSRQSPEAMRRLRQACELVYQYTST